MRRFGDFGPYCGGLQRFTCVRFGALGVTGLGFRSATILVRFSLVSQFGLSAGTCHIS